MGISVGMGRSALAESKTQRFGLTETGVPALGARVRVLVPTIVTEYRTEHTVTITTARMQHT
ncbi:hypothetical protein N7481_003080 [Penicillium waksmanii]|uniref:uncharacterized protein n=1 Tax=Penicillium waksmanii TaxID=69791 RepID=UPI002548A0C5|nr:uncharacterized protein N7481_003080 [Penicillium waksmanii]KAJ5987870.1 hypothetical protein N7481_003080 [Penicillium waksmanii]